MKISSQIQALLPLRHGSHRCIEIKDGATVVAVFTGAIGIRAATKLQKLIVTAVNSHQALAEELTAAEQIIQAMLNAMTAAQKRAVHECLAAAGVSDEGMTRYHERRAALELAGAV